MLNDAAEQGNRGKGGGSEVKGCWNFWALFTTIYLRLAALSYKTNYLRVCQLNYMDKLLGLRGVWLMGPRAIIKFDGNKQHDKDKDNRKEVGEQGKGKRGNEDKQTTLYV